MGKPGWIWQEVGDWGEDLVRAQLSDDSITVRSVERDPGEDFMVEPDGRRATALGSQPRVALLQVKGSRTEHDAAFADVRGLPRARLLRWSAQQYPVFVVFIAGSSGKRTFARAVDDYLKDEFHGRDIGELTQKTMSMRLPRVDNLPRWVREKVDEFYNALVPDFGSLTPTQRLEHFEVEECGPPSHYQRATMYGRRVLWTGHRRPAYFAALVRELVRIAQHEIGGRRLPALVNFHVYRSRTHLTNNMAVARIRWFEKEHPNVAPHLANYEELQIKPSEESDEMSAFWAARRMPPATFMNQVLPLIEHLDTFCERVISEGGRVWTPRGNEEFDEMWHRWDHETGLAPIELEPAASFLSSYIMKLDEHRVWTQRLDEQRWRPGVSRLSEARRVKLIRETTKDLRGYLGASKLLIRSLGW